MRLRPFFQSSCPSMNVTSPAAISTPNNLPPSSQRSPAVKPSTSRYHARLRSISFTVKLGDASRRLVALPETLFERAGLTAALALTRFPLVLGRLVFFVAMFIPPSIFGLRL